MSRAGRLFVLSALLSAPACGSHAATLSLAAPLDYQVVQRESKDLGRITIAGNLTGAQGLFLNLYFTDSNGNTISNGSAWVTLASANGTEAGATDETLSAAAIPPLRVLGVEDNPFGRVVLNTILAERGHQAEFVGRGEVAAERIAQGGFDAVLMDMVLEGIDGIETIRRIRALKSPFGRIPIIGVSGRGDDEAAARAAGADAFRVKPVSPRALAIALLEASRHAAGAT